MCTIFSFILVVGVASGALILLTAGLTPRPYSRELHKDDGSETEP